MYRDISQNQLHEVLSILLAEGVSKLDDKSHGIDDNQSDSDILHALASLMKAGEKVL
jgi:hypothetical protein